MTKTDEAELFRCKNPKCRAALGRVEGASLIVSGIKLTGNFRVRCDVCGHDKDFQSSNLRKVEAIVLLVA